jgi:hypothetical protein
MMRSCSTCALAEWNWMAIPSILNDGQQSHQEEWSFQEIHCANLDWSHLQEEG